jgi:hypothetical protein
MLPIKFNLLKNQKMVVGKRRFRPGAEEKRRSP